MNNAEQFSVLMAEYIQKIAGKQLENKIVSGVVSGVVIQVVNNGSYQVQLSGGDDSSSIYAFSIGNKLYQKDDYVYMIYYLNGTERVYCIYDTVQNTAQDYFNLTLDERFAAEEDLNYSFTDLDIELKYSEADYKKYIEKIRESGCFRIEAQFQSNSSEGEDFGLKIELSQNGKEPRVEYFNTSYFLGQPDKLSSAVTQSRIITLSSEEKNNLESIKIATFGNNFSYQNIKLICGTLLNIESVFSASLSVENDKNYFSPDEYEDAITLSSQVTQDGRELNSNSLSYYWVVEDEDSFDRTGYPDFIDSGWRCLNEYIDTTKVVEAEEVNIRIWKKASQTITIEEKEEDINSLFPKFLNKVKCIITYKDIVVESREVEIYNYYKEEFNIILSSNTNPAYILTEGEQIILTCEIITENPKIKIQDYNYTYIWYKKDFDEDIKIIESENKELIRENKDLEENVIESIYCKVLIKNKEGAWVSEEGPSNIITVESKIKEDNIITSNKNFKYYISTNMSVSFEKIIEDGEEGQSSIWTGDWSINDADETNPSWINLIEGETEENLYAKIFETDDIFETFEGDSNIIYYVYYTERTSWSQSLQAVPIRVDNWIEPELARSVSYDEDGWTNSKVGEAINQINIFNKLTKNGTLQGIHFDGDNAYIDADFINTGTLRVGDEGDEKFYASIHSEDVKIGGFTVGQKSLTSSSIEDDETSTVYLGTDGIKINDYLAITEEEKQIAGWQISNESLTNKSNNVILWSTENEEDFAITAGIYFPTLDITNINIVYKVSTDRSEVDEDSAIASEYIDSFIKEDDEYVIYCGSDRYVYSKWIEIDGVQYDVWNCTHESQTELTEGKKELYINRISEPNFSLDNNGKLFAKEAEIEGEIRANSGQFGPLEIKEDGSIEAENFYVSPLGIIEAQGGRFYGAIRSEDYINGLKLVNWGDPSQTLSADGSFFIKENSDGQQITYYIDSRFILKYSAPREENEEMVVDIIDCTASTEEWGVLKQIIIPSETKEGYKVVGIKSASFSECSQLENIICRSQSLQFVETGAFDGCNSIKNIYFEYSSSVNFETGWIPENNNATEWLYIIEPSQNIDLAVTNFKLPTSLTGKLGLSIDNDFTYRGDIFTYTQIYNLNLIEIQSISITMGGNVIASADTDNGFNKGLNDYTFSLAADISYTSRDESSFIWWTGMLQSITYEASEKTLIFSWSFTPWANSANTKVMGGFCSKIFDSKWISNIHIAAKGVIQEDKYYYSSELPNDEIKANRWHWDRNYSQQGWQIGNNNEMPYSIQNADIGTTEAPETIIDTMYFKVDQYGKVVTDSINAQGGIIGPLQIEDPTSIIAAQENNIQLGGFSLKDIKIQSSKGSYLDFSQPEAGVTSETEQSVPYYLQLKIITASNRKNDKFTVTAYSDEECTDTVSVKRNISGTVSITAENIFNPGPFQFSFTIEKDTSTYEHKVNWNLGISTDTYSYYFVTVDGNNLASQKATFCAISPSIGNSIIVGGTLLPPEGDTSCLIGRSDRKWNHGYFDNINASPVTTDSDKNIKYDIKYINDEYDQLYDSFQPASFKYINGTSGRTHIGVVAQDVKQALDECGIDSQDFAAYCSWKKEDGTETCGIRYGEFVALNMHEIQKAKKRISELEKTVEMLVSRLAELENE